MQLKTCEKKQLKPINYSKKNADIGIRTRVIDLGNAFQQEKSVNINPSTVDKYFTLRDIQGINRKWQRIVKNG